MLITTAAALAVIALAQPCDPTWDTAIGDAPTNGSITKFEVFDAGDGAELYSTGNYTQIDGQLANRVARWSGSQWFPLGTGLSSQFSNDLEVFDGSLYAGGYFDSAGGAMGSAKIARWDGEEWHGLNAANNFWRSVYAPCTSNVARPMSPWGGDPAMSWPAAAHWQFAAMTLPLLAAGFMLSFAQFNPFA